jgi:transposase
MSKCTATASQIQVTATTPTLLLAFELGESGWLLGFSPGFGERVLRRKIAARDTAALMREILRAKAHFQLGDEVAVRSCYEAGRDGFWRRALLRSEETGASMAKVWRMLELRGVGIESAWCYGMEFFGWRSFANRRQVGSLAGLTPTPHDSGTQEREKGIGKDGSRWVRGVAIEQAWAWLRFQPESALSQRYQSRFGGGSKRMRKIGIVALARKLLIALWRYVEFGELPEGAVRTPRVRLV